MRPGSVGVKLADGRGVRLGAVGAPCRGRVGLACGTAPQAARPSRNSPTCARGTSTNDPLQQSILPALAGESSSAADPVLLHGSRADFGDPDAELHALLHATALLDATDEGCVRIAGPDAADFLQRVLAGEVRSLGPGEVRPNLLLSAKGRVRASFELVRLGEDEFLALCAPEAGAALASAFDAYHIAEDLQLSDRTAGYAPLALLGPGAGESLRRALPHLPLPAAGRALRAEFDGRPLVVVHRPRHGAPGFLLDAGPDGAARLWRSLVAAGARPCGRWAREWARISAREALQGIDLDEQRYPQEARLEGSFSLSKGCYVGQEVVAKLDTYGGLQRRLVVLESDGPLTVGDELHGSESERSREIGRVASSVRRPRGGSLALAYVRLEHEAPGGVLHAGSEAVPVRVVEARR